MRLSAHINQGDFSTPIIQKETPGMNIGLLIIMIIGGLAGILSTLYIVVSLPFVIIQKFYRKIRFGTSIMK